jgi:atypical dual specificity phosphatase
MSFLQRVIFKTTLFYGKTLAQLGYRDWYTRIDERVILGAIPQGRDYLDTLIATEDVKGVISVIEDFELESIGCRVSSIPVPTASSRHLQTLAHLHIVARDFVEAPSVNQIENALSFIDQVHSSTRGTVYVHCKAGRTRSATVVACYLIQRYSFTPEQAINRLIELRPHVILAEPHRATIELFNSKLEAEKQTRSVRSSARY